MNCNQNWDLDLSGICDLPNYSGDVSCTSMGTSKRIIDTTINIHLYGIYII